MEKSAKLCRLHHDEHLLNLNFWGRDDLCYWLNANVKKVIELYAGEQTINHLQTLRQLYR